MTIDVESLENIDWRTLTCAYGEASRVPQLLRDLCSDDNDTVSAAYENLFDLVWHQTSDVFDSTTACIPYLFQIADNPSSLCRCRVLTLLGGLAQAARRPLDHLDIDEQLRQENVFRDIVVTLHTHLPSAVRNLDDPLPNVRTVAAFTGSQIALSNEMLSQAADHQDDLGNLKELFLERLRSEQSSLVRKSLGCATLLLAETDARVAFNTTVSPLLQSDTERLACTLLLAQSNCALSESEQKQLVDASQDWKRTNETFGGSALVDAGSENIFPWFIPSVSAALFGLLLQEPLIQRSDTAQVLAQSISKSNRLTIQSACDIAAAYFGKQPIERVFASSRITANGLMILKAIAQNDSLWAEGSPFFGKLQHQLGLADSAIGRKQLEALIHSVEPV